MPEPIRVRIAEIIYPGDHHIQRNVRPSPYRVKDSVNISKEAFEKFRARSPQKLHSPPTRQREPAPDLIQGEQDEQEKKSHQDPELRRNLRP
jgi:hypothetical protein